VSDVPGDELHPSASSDTDASIGLALRRITDTSDAMSLVKDRDSDEAIAAKSELAWAVGIARDLGVSWQTIGDALGMRRGAAYQRFRERPASRKLDVHESPIDGVTLLSVRGELDALTAQKLVEAIAGALTKVQVGLIVELSEVTFLATAGVTALLDGQRVARSSGKQFGVIADGPAASRPLTVTGADRMLDLYPTVDAAMKGMHQRAGDIGD
jgi:anti-sigma B factor antagonist